MKTVCHVCRSAFRLSACNSFSPKDFAACTEEVRTRASWLRADPRRAVRLRAAAGAAARSSAVQLRASARSRLRSGQPGPAQSRAGNGELDCHGLALLADALLRRAGSTRRVRKRSRSRTGLFVPTPGCSHPVHEAVVCPHVMDAGASREFVGRGCKISALRCGTGRSSAAATYCKIHMTWTMALGDTGTASRNQKTW